MENKENITNEINSENSLNASNSRQITPELIIEIAGTAKWMTYFAVILLAGVIILFTLEIIMFQSTAAEQRSGNTASLSIFMILISLLSLFVLHIANKFKRFARLDSAPDLESAFRLQKRLWQTTGWIIIAITFIGICTFLFHNKIYN
ncbi:MAG: hypothetical protein LBK94_03865 [Prevotellaceae bacterium]|jgi:ABC-type Fe3+ transport system permease subunit|nr:hypothetical protein [Prevotellaceae bacterium]